MLSQQRHTFDNFPPEAMHISLSPGIPRASKDKLRGGNKGDFAGNIQNERSLEDYGMEEFLWDLASWETDQWLEGHVAEMKAIQTAVANKVPSEKIAPAISIQGSQEATAGEAAVAVGGSSVIPQYGTTGAGDSVSKKRKVSIVGWEGPRKYSRCGVEVGELRDFWGITPENEKYFLPPTPGKRTKRAKLVRHTEAAPPQVKQVAQDPAMFSAGFSAPVTGWTGTIGALPGASRFLDISPTDSILITPPSRSAAPMVSVLAPVQDGLTSLPMMDHAPPGFEDQTPLGVRVGCKRSSEKQKAKAEGRAYQTRPKAPNGSKAKKA